MAENIPPEQKNFYKAVRDSLSQERIEAYQRRDDRDELDAIARYLWNIALCEALYPCLHSFEIVLRNSIHSTLSRRYGSQWFQSKTLLRRIEQDKIFDAEEALLAQGKAIEPGRIIAEMTLGFWTGLLVHYYDRSIVIPLMQTCLRSFPGALRNRRTLYDRFEDVRYLRNRVFHYEPVWYWEDLPKRHTALLDDIGFMNPTKKALISLLDRFPAVHAEGWEGYRARIEQSLFPLTL